MSTAVMSDNELPTYESIMKDVADYTSQFAATEKPLLQTHFQSISVANTESNEKIPDFSFLSPEEKEKLTLEIAKLLSSEKGQAIMNTVAKRFNKDIADIRKLFLDLYNRIKELDDEGKSARKFAPQLAEFRKNFQEYVDESRDLASEIANYAESFEELILPLYRDPTVTLAQKKVLIENYVQEALGFSDKCKAQKKTFDDMSIQFSAYVGEFKDWALDEEHALDNQVNKVKKRLGELQEKLAGAFQNAKLSLGSGIGTGALGVVFLGLLFPAALPIILIGGAVVAGAGAVVAGGFGVYAETIKTQIKDANKELKDLEDKLAKNKKTREDLVKLGKDSFAQLDKSLESIILVWESARMDARNVMAALQKGKQLADLEPGLRIQLNKSVNIYKTLAVYLRGYASGSTGE